MKVRITSDDRRMNYQKFEAVSYGQVILADGNYDFKISGYGGTENAAKENFEIKLKQLIKELTSKVTYK
jgi:hypothetical protein